MRGYRKSASIATWAIGFLKVSPFHEKILEKNKTSSRFFSAIAALKKNLDYLSGEEKLSFVPPEMFCSMDSTQVCNNLQNLRKNPSVAFAYFKDCENHGFCHDHATYTAIISILYNANPKQRLAPLFSNLTSLNTNPGLISSILFSLLQLSNGPALVSLALDDLLKSYKICNKDPQEAANLFFHLGRLGFLPTVRSCNFLLNFVAEYGDLGTLINVFDHMRGFHINPDVYSFTILMKFFLKAKQPSEAIRVLGLMQQMGLKPDRFTYLTFLSGTFVCKRYDLSYAILQVLIREGMKVSPIDFNMVISGFCKESKLDEAENLLQTMSKHMPPDHCTYGHIIRAYCEKGNFLKALDLYEEMTARGIKTTPHIVAHLLQTLHKLGKNNEVLSCFMKLKESAFLLDSVLYNIALNACCQLGLIKEAKELIQEMRNNGLDPDRIHYTCLIAGFCYKGDVINACIVFVEMLKLGLQPDTVTYNVLLSGFCNNGFTDQAGVILQQMMVQGIELNNNTYGLVIEVLCKVGKVSEAELLFKALEQKNSRKHIGQGQSHLFSSMVAGYLHRGLIEQAYGLFLCSSQDGYLINKYSREWLIRELCNDDKVKLASNVFSVLLRDHQVVPDLLSYAKLITAFCRRGDMSGALFWFEDMLNNGMYADLLIYTTLMDGFCKVGRLRDACELFVKMACVGIKPDVVAYNVLLDGLFKNVFENCWSETARERRKFEIKAKTLKLIQRMVEDGIEPDVACYSVLINGQCKIQHLNQAEKLFKEMLWKGFSPDVQVYTALINGYCHVGKTEKAQELFQKMIDSGIRPDSVALYVLEKVMLQADEKKEDRSPCINIACIQGSSSPSMSSCSGGQPSDAFPIVSCPKCGFDVAKRI